MPFCIYNRGLEPSLNHTHTHAVAWCECAPVLLTGSNLAFSVQCLGLIHFDMWRGRTGGRTTDHVINLRTLLPESP